MADTVPGKLGGLIRRKLVREIALGELNYAALAEKYEVNPSAISYFAKRHADEIKAVREKADDEFAGLLITQKGFRLGALQDLLERALTEVPKVAPSGRVVYVTDPETGQETMVKEIAGELAAKVLKQAAEEMGQLPTRLQLSGRMEVATTYAVDGVAPDDLA